MLNVLLLFLNFYPIFFLKNPFPDFQGIKKNVHLILLAYVNN